MSTNVMGFAEDQEDVARCHEAMTGLWSELTHADFVRRVMQQICRVQNFKGHQFYARKGMDITSHHFGMALKKEENSA